METTQIVEALLFSSDAPLTAGDISRADESLDEDRVEAAVSQLRKEYERTGRAFQVYELAGGYQLLTRPEYGSYLERFATVPQSARLSGPALEVLAIVAYRQPIGRSEIEDIRGVGSSGVLRTLQDRALIEVVGRGDSLGRPLLYGTTDRFLEHFGFQSLEDLPRPDDLPVVLKEQPRDEVEDDAGDDAAEVAGDGGDADGRGEETDADGDGDADEEVDEKGVVSGAVADGGDGGVEVAASDGADREDSAPAGGEADRTV